MSDVVIKVENLGKQYRLGQVGTGTLSHDLNRWWYKARGKEDPYLKIGEANDRSVKGESDLVWALKDINFEVKRGEVLGIIGKNGAGKSTLLKILSQVTGPTIGEIKVKGRIASLLEVGTGFHPELTGRENIYLNGAILGMTKAEIKSKFDEIVDFSGVERYIDTPVKRYSSGMYVRLAFAVAAHLEPEILIVDEVLAVGDAEFQKKCLGKMKDVSGQGRTVLFVSHQLGTIKSICNRGIALQNGGKCFDGTAINCVNYYINDYVDKSFPTSVKFELDEAKDAQVVSCRLLNSQGREAAKFDVFEQVILEVEYCFRKDMLAVDCGFTIEYNEEILANTFDIDLNPERLELRQKGTYVFRIELFPANKAGIYKISNLGLGKTNIGTIHSIDHAISFEVNEDDQDYGFKSYSRNRVGMIVSNFEWKLMSYKEGNS